MKEYRTNFKGVATAQSDQYYKSQIVDPKKRRYSSQKFLDKPQDNYYNKILNSAEEKKKVSNENDYVYKSNMKNIAIRAQSH